MRLPAQAARQLPDQSTTLRVDSSSTDDSRLRGALPLPGSCSAAKSVAAGSTGFDYQRSQGWAVGAALGRLFVEWTLISLYLTRPSGKAAAARSFTC